MADLYEGLQVSPTDPAPAAPRAPAGLYDGLQLAPAAPVAREATGFVESAQAGLQGSAPGLAWRGRMPDLVMNPETSKWWERAAASFAHVGAELPLMIGGAMAGAPLGAPAGPVGSLLAAGFGMGVVPATIRQSLIEAYKSGEIKTAADWFNAAREVATQALKEGGINAAAMGMGALAKAGIATAGGANAATAKAIGVGTATPLTRAGAVGSETADLATQIATMVAMPAALEQRMPGMQEFIDAAILVGGLKAAHVTAKRMMTTYEKTGKTPAEQVADAQVDPTITEDVVRQPVDPITLTTSGVPVKLDRIIAEAEFLARGGVPEAPSIKAIIKEIKEEGPLQGDMVADIERIGALYDQARAAPLTNPERLELETLRSRVSAYAAGRDPGGAPGEPVTRYTPEQATGAAERGRARLEELAAKTEALTDQERAERVFLTNATPEAMARYFKVEPTLTPRPTAAAQAESAQRVHDDILKQLRDVDQARRDSGLAPLGEEHAGAVAALVRARVRTRAARLGVLPEEIYAERPLQIRDETSAEVKAAEAAIPPEAPRFLPPEVDLFGAPIDPQVTPRFAVENMATVELPLAGLVLSKEVPQFKSAADAAGVVVPLGGKFDRTGVGPIQVWERLDGTLEVISGRHRLDLARRSGEETIPAQVHREAEGFDARQAATLDAQLNIREEQGSVADYAQYFKDSGLSKEAADERGLLARAKGRTGFAIARDGSPDLLASHRAGVLSDEAALVISQAAPGSARLQALGITMVQEGKSNLIAVNTMRAVDLMAAERMAAGAQGDIFGFDDSAMREASKMAKLASSKQRKISEQISAVSGASKRPELARKMGVDVQDPDGIQKRIVELRQEQYLWDNWPLHPELVAKLRSDPEVAGREGDLKQGPVGLREDETQWYHGTRTEIADFSRGDEVYLTDRPAEAAGYAKGLHLGGTGHEKPRVYSVAAKKGKVLNIDNMINEEIMGDGDIEVAIKAGIAKAEAEGARYVEYHHPAFEGEAEQKVVISLWPSQDLRITRTPTKDKGGVLFQEPFDLKPETPTELDARNAEAYEQARRRHQQEAVAARTEKWPDLRAEWDKYDDAGTSTVRELVEAVDALVDDGRAPASLTEVTRNFKEAIREDFEEFAGRGDVEPHEDAFVAAVRAALAEDPNTLFQSGPAERWYSALTRAVEASPTKAAPAQGWKDWLRGLTQKGVKADEIKWSGIEEWLDLQEGRVTKEQVREYLAGNGVKVTEKMLGEQEPTSVEPDISGDYEVPVGMDQPKFSQYVLPGAKEGSYRELLLTLPEKEAPKSTHRPLDLIHRDLRITALEAGEPRPMPSFWRPNGTGFEELYNSNPRFKELRDEWDAAVSADNKKAEAKFTSSHFDEPNILAHVRFNEREVPREEIAPLADIGRRLVEAVGATSERSLGSGAPVVGVRDGIITQAEAYAYGKAKGFTNADDYKAAAVDRVLFIEEIQSDWAQQGKRRGFAGQEKAMPSITELLKEYGWKIEEAPADIGNGEAAPAPWQVTFRDGSKVYYDTEWIAHQELASEWRKDNPTRPDAVPAGPFVGKTEAWVALTLKRMILYAAENGMDRVAWTTGEQQVSRYTSALRKAVDVIEWTKTPEAVQLVGYKGAFKEGGPTGVRQAVDDILRRNEFFGFDTEVEARQAILEHPDWEVRWDAAATIPQQDVTLINNWRRLYLTSNAAGQRRQKVVDTTEKEDVLSDAIGKAMADRIIKDPNQSGTIEGENIKIDDTGMATFYDRIVPNVAKDVLKKLGGGKVGETTITAPDYTAFGQSERLPEVTPAPEGIPALRPMEGRDRMGLDGLEDFPNGNKPITGDGSLTINGQITEVMVVADRSGVHLFGEHGGEQFEMSVYSDMAGAREAKDLIAHMWSPDSAPIWTTQLQVQNGVFARPQGVTTKQLSFDITPAMRDKAMEGLPLFQKERASYQIAEKLITTMQGADKSSVVHELGHDWLQEMKEDALRPDAPAQLRQDWEILRRELAIGEEGEISRPSHEQFARSVERYLADGEAPSVELRGVFEQFKKWLLEIYQNMLNLNVQVNPELARVLDRMLATDQEIADARALDVPRAYVAEAKVQEARRIVPGFKAEQVAIEPYADQLPKGPGEAPDDSHVNYATVDGPMKIKLTLQRLAEIDQQNIQKHRGGKDGVESWQQEQATMEKWILDTMGGGEDQLKLVRGGDPNDPKTNHMLRAKKQLMIGAGHASEKMRDVILEKGHNATIEEQLQYLSSIELLRQVHAEFLGERAAVARAMNALKDTTEGSAAINSMLETIGRGQDSNTMFQSATEKAAADQAMLKARLDEILLRYKGQTVLDIAKLHKEVGTLKGTFKLAEVLEKATTWEMVIEGWKSLGLLSGPVTHTTNLFGTQAFMALRTPVDALAAIIGMARGASPGMGESDRASMSEAVARITGMLAGVGDGLKVAYHTYRLDDPTGKTEAYRTAIPGRAGEIIRIPFRLMGATDALNTTMYGRGELWGLAIRQAFDEGHNPSTAEFARRVTELKDNPTPEMKVAADAAATRMTFNAPLGEKGVALQLFVAKWNLQWMIPFIRTPINITKEVARMSPFAPLVGEWRADIAKGGAARDRAIAETAIGTGIMALTVAYAFAGSVSGSGSPDPGKNRGKAGVWQPNSILIGNTWYEYTRIQPTGTLMGLAADMAMVWDHMTDEEKDKVPKLLARAFSNAVTNQTFLQGITNVVNAMSDPARFAPSFLKQLAGSLVPNIIGQTTAMADPVVREVNSALEAIQARIPGLRQDLIPKRDWLGQEVRTKERLGIVGPVRTMDVSKDKVRLEAARLDISMALAPKKTHIGKGTGKLGDVELTPEERNTYARVGGEMAHQILTNIVNAPGYDEIPPLIQRRIFSKVLTASHQMAAVAALPPDKRAAHLQSISEKVAAELTGANEQ